MKSLIKNLSFGLTIFERGDIQADFYFNPKRVWEVVRYWNDYGTSWFVQELLQGIERQNIQMDPNIEIEFNDLQIFIRKKDIVTFDVENITGLKPVDLHISDVRYLFGKYRDWLAKYETGGIPSLIPRRKRDKWLIVPKEAVKEEYLKELEKENKG